MSRAASEHLRWHELIDALESPEGLPASMKAHVDECSSCNAMCDAAVHMLALLERTRFPRVPDDLVTRAVNRVIRREADPETEQMPIWQGLLASLRARLLQIEATPILESQTASNAFRGGDPTNAAPTLLFEADDYSVTLVFHAAPQAAGGDDLRGQVIMVADNELPSGSYALLHWPDEVVRSPLSNTGEFHFGAVPRTPLRLALILGRRFLTLGPLPRNAP